jgi:hypothetical protein
MKSEEDFEQVFLSARATVAPKPDRAGIFESKPSTPLVPENGTTGATSGGAGSWRPELIGAPDLCDRKFHELRYIVHGIIPEGVTLLVHPSGIEGLIFGSWGYAIRREASLRRSSGRAWPWWR